MRALRLFLAVLLALLLAPALGQTQGVLQQLVSPGKLSRAHAHLETRCEACHAKFDKTGQTRLCMGCHKDVAGDIARRQGFHGKSPGASGACKSCHTDHVGRAADIVHAPSRGFNHAFTDYALKGKHAQAPCASCHVRGVKFRNAPTACIGCHRNNDVHKGGLGDACQRCHTEQAWKSVTFDHGATRFPLLGAHARVACAACHAGGRFKGAPTACVSCHAKQDIHGGRLGAACGDCHVASGWNVARFDHRRTGFALTGAHARIDCAACHAGGRFKGTPETCFACHARKDVHQGRFGAGCADCHTTQAWNVTRFDHGKTGFPLKGLHADVECAQCHTGPDKARTPTTCVSCHQADDVHKGGNGPRCEECHSDAGWKLTSFNHTTQTRFPLEGKHAQAACNLCHLKPAREVKIGMACNDCHARDDAHAGQEGPACGTCHNARGWKIDVFFDHDQTAFPLIGKHAGQVCSACHASARFKDAKAGCVDCHQKDDKHKGRLGPACATCHTPADWAIWRFDHDTQTRYPLTGAHAGLSCEGCHTAPTTGRVKQSDACISCHSKDDIHRGSFGLECQQCHNTNTFRRTNDP